MRSSLISASTMTENGFDMLRAVVENDLEATQDALDEARDEALLLNAEDVRSKRRQEEVKIFMALCVAVLIVEIIVDSRLLSRRSSQTREKRCE